MCGCVCESVGASVRGCVLVVRGRASERVVDKGGSRLGTQFCQEVAGIGMNYVRTA
jgi:hypothetical protein